MNIDFSLLSNLAAIILAIFAVYRGFRSQKRDDAKTDADAAKAYGEAAEKAQARADRLEMRADIQDAKISELECKVNDLEKIIATRDQLIAEWQYGIERLLAQLKSHELDPVWRPRKAGSE